MVGYQLNTIEDAEKLLRVCHQYKDLLTIDVIYGRYIIDGTSTLGVLSLLGKTVTIEAIGDETEKERLYDNIRHLS